MRLLKNHNAIIISWCFIKYFLCATLKYHNFAKSQYCQLYYIHINFKLYSFSDLCSVIIIVINNQAKVYLFEFLSSAFPPSQNTISHRETLTFAPLGERIVYIIKRASRVHYSCGPPKRNQKGKGPRWLFLSI